MARSRTRVDYVTGEVTRSTTTTCECGKVLFTRKKEAIEAAARQRREWADPDIRAYHSYPCHGYHLGHPTPRRDREDP